MDGYEIELRERIAIALIAAGVDVESIPLAIEQISLAVLSPPSTSTAAPPLSKP
jgi:hypothetical protein